MTFVFRTANGRFAPLMDVEQTFAASQKRTFDQPANRQVIYVTHDPGHETYPVYHNEHVLKVIANGIRWANQKHTDGRILENWRRREPLHERSR